MVEGSEAGATVVHEHTLEHKLPYGGIPSDDQDSQQSCTGEPREAQPH